jgi:hypothetical protein
MEPHAGLAERVGRLHLNLRLVSMSARVDQQVRVDLLRKDATWSLSSRSQVRHGASPHIPFEESS